jgi:UDP-N-acetylglucosamine--N-acetylmuramyl-(pentapeptide) pyrophosphoryl-undecaprenol N-acetylglucosamine transferase
MSFPAPTPFVAIACGGTGGHLFPGLAVGEALVRRGVSVALLISPKEVDQEAVNAAKGMEVITLPAVAFEARRPFQFVRGFWRAFATAQRQFRQHPPEAVLAMGGFAGAPPILAARLGRAATFIHESNAIPGRANRWLAPWVDGVLVGFPSAARRFWSRAVLVTGTPVRPLFRSSDAAACRTALGLDPLQPVLLVMGGSQGARAINQLMLQALPLLRRRLPDLQFIHLTGPHDEDAVRSAYAVPGCRAVVRPFLAEMPLAMGAATAAINRAGASSLAELAAVRLPAILIPYPTATDNHQYVNALEFAQTGAARMLLQRSANAPALTRLVEELVRPGAARQQVRAALKQWDWPEAAEDVAGRVLAAMRGERVNPASPRVTDSVGRAGGETPPAQPLAVRSP